MSAPAPAWGCPSRVASSASTAAGSTSAAGPGRGLHSRRTSRQEPRGVQPRVLIVDDDREMCSLLQQTLSRREFEPVARADATGALALLKAEDFDAVITDLNMPGMNGVELCQRIASSRPDVPVIVITAFGSLDTATAAIRAGAYDFVTKPFEVEQLLLALDRAVRLRRLTSELTRLRTTVGTDTPDGPLVGRSPAM